MRSTWHCNVGKVTVENWWGTVASGIFAGLASGISVGSLTGIVRARQDERRARTARRKKIMSLLAQAKMLAFRALRDRVYENQYFSRRDTDEYKAFRKEYDDLTAEALGLFEPGEWTVAQWTQIEFYAGFHDFFYFARETGIKRKLCGSMVVGPDAEGAYSVEDNGDIHLHGFVFPRPEKLAAWVDGESSGPRYGDLIDYPEGERIRHRVVPPNTDVAWDMLTSPVGYIEGAREAEESRRAEAQSKRWWLRGVQGRSPIF